MSITRYQFKLNGKQFVLASDHDDEVAHLKAEVVRLQQVRDYEHYLSTQIGSMNQENARLKAEVERLAMAGNQSIAVGAKLREMVGDHHWSMEFDRVRTDWYHASRDALTRRQNPNTPPTAVQLSHQILNHTKQI